MKLLRFIVMLLMVVGSLNWGLVGFFGYDLISDVFGGMGSTGARFIFALVGLAGLYGIGFLCRCCGCRCKCGPNCHCCHKKD
jgi:uncharacterized membrane protein YuzA (DUF378 family)